MKGNWLNLSDEDIKTIVKEPAETLQELVKRQNEESYQLGKKHGAIEELDLLRKRAEILEWYDRFDKKHCLDLINGRIEELKGENNE